MKKNLYFKKVFSRENLIKNFFYDLFIRICSYPKMLIEVFIRKNFGERYFSLSSAISVMVVLLVWPLFGSKISNLLISFSEGYSYGNPPSVWGKYVTWYIFTATFAYFVYLRWQEVKRNPSVFDFGRFSLYSGDIHLQFYKIKIFGGRPSVRTIEIFYEPLLAFAVGLILFLIGQSLGSLLIGASIIYCISYAAAYKTGDDFVMDKIDEMIMNEELESAFVEDLIADNTRGVRFHARKPKAKSLRRKIADSFVEDNTPQEEKTFAE